MRLSAFESCALQAFDRCTPRSNRLTLCSSVRSPCSSCSTIFSSSPSCSSKLAGSSGTLLAGVEKLGIDRSLLTQAEHLSRGVEVAERRTHLNTLYLAADLCEHLLGN